MSQDRSVLRSERVDELFDELLKFAASRGSKLAQDAGVEVPDELLTLDDAVLDSIADQVRSALEDEVVPATEVSNGSIDEYEVNREVMKKALIGLGLQDLRKIATRSDVNSVGPVAEVAERIARRYHWDREEIARLILENEEVSDSAHAHSARLFPLEEAPDLDVVSRRLGALLGRYIRTGVAQWFVFEELSEADPGLILRGSLRSYKAQLSADLDNPRVEGVPAPVHSVLVLITPSELAQVRRANATQSSAAVKALDVAGVLKPVYGVVPKSGSMPRSISASPHAQFMLDLLTARLRIEGLGNVNPTSAKFRAEAGDTTLPEQPQLKAVKFEGTHILDSPAACRFIDEGRALLDLAFRVQSPQRKDQEPGWFPSRVSFERDHLLVMTGFGGVPSASFEVHEALIRAVVSELSHGVSDSDNMEAMLQRISERSGQASPGDEADVLSPRRTT